MYASLVVCIAWLVVSSEAFVNDRRLCSYPGQTKFVAPKIRSLKLAENINDLHLQQMRELESLIDSIANLTKGRVLDEMPNSVDPILVKTASPSRDYAAFSQMVKKAQSIIDEDESQYNKKPSPKIEIPVGDLSTPVDSGIKFDSSEKSLVPVPASKPTSGILSAVARLMIACSDMSMYIQTKAPSLIVHSVFSVWKLFRGTVGAVLGLFWSVVHPPLSVLTLALTNALLWNYAVNYLLVNGTKFLPSSIVSFLHAHDLWIASPAYLIVALGWMVWSVVYFLLFKKSCDSRYQLVNGFQCVMYSLLRGMQQRGEQMTGANSGSSF